jgi:hypothetical protein
MAADGLTPIWDLNAVYRELPLEMARWGGETMNSWFVLAAFLLAALILGWVGHHFSLRTLRVAAASVTAAAVVGITWYGLAHPAQAPGSLSDAFTRGADALSTALFHPASMPPGHHFPGPGRTGWVVITILLVIGYRELEAWSWHCHARSLDTSALAGDQQGDASEEGAVTDKQRHDWLAAELKFRLPAVEVRSPAILPGGSRSDGLASIAEASGITGSGLAGAIIQFFGMLWPSPRRLQVRVWVERNPDQVNVDNVTRVTIDLEDPRSGASIATKTLAASNLDDAASLVAGYVARYIFDEDPTAPPWCTGTADGRDLAALLLARQVRVYPESAHHVHHARHTQIRVLESVAHSNVCAGVTRYELAQLYDLSGRHVDALLLHAINRERYPHFYRGRYRLAMSLEMIANLDSRRDIHPAEWPKLQDALKILHRCRETKSEKDLATYAAWGKLPIDKLSIELRAYLLDTAWHELGTIRRHLTLRHIIWRSFWHRDERGILLPYLRLRHRQSFHDGACAAMLLVLIRRRLIDTQPGPAPKLPDPAYRLRGARTMGRIATAIAGDSSTLLTTAGASRGMLGQASSDEPPSIGTSLRTRRWPRQHSTRSWQAAYNLACAYAAIAQDRKQKLRDGQAEDDLHDLVTKVVYSLVFAVCNPDCEMERPSEWIANDPDFDCLRSRHDGFSQGFRDFLADQEQRDYPKKMRTRSPRRTPVPVWTSADVVAAAKSALTIFRRRPHQPRQAGSDGVKG